MSQKEYRVLVVDDEPDAVEEMVLTLESAGMTTVGAKSPREALSTFLANASIGVVVTDLRMPGKDGLSFVDELRKSGPRGRDCEVIVTTGLAEFDLARRAIDLRVARYLIKPIEPSELLVSVSAGLYTFDQTLSVRHDKSNSPNVETRSVDSADDANSVHPAQSSDERIDKAPDGNELRIGALESILRLRDVRSQYLPSELFSDPAWFMLVDLALTQLKGRRVSVSGLCQSSGVSQTTALRRVQDLVDMGLVDRVEDATDRRRFYLKLSASGHERLNSIIDRLFSPGGDG